MLLKIPFSETSLRELAKQSGAKWQPESKLWYIDDQNVPDDLRKFAVEVKQLKASLGEILDDRVGRHIVNVLTEAAKDAGRNGKYSNTTKGMLGDAFGDGDKEVSGLYVASVAKGLAAKILRAGGLQPADHGLALGDRLQAPSREPAKPAAPAAREDTRPYTRSDNDVPF